VKTLWSIRNLSENTQKTYSKLLKRLAKNCELTNPVKVEKYVFNQDWKNTTRNLYFDAYNHFCKANEIAWDRPKINNNSYPVKIPTEEKIDLIISTATKRYSTVFHLSKHGLRPDEISKITLRDLDLERGTLLVKTSKLGLERTIKLDNMTLDLIKDYLVKNKISKINKRLFAKSKTLRQKWSHYRKKAFDKFKDPELLKIRLYDLRHWFGTMTYIKTRDIFHVKYLMGHRHIQSTLYYMHIAKGLINYSEDYTVKVANTLNEYVELLKSGFEYVSDYDDKKILRKRK
jgi:integrase